MKKKQIIIDYDEYLEMQNEIEKSKDIMFKFQESTRRERLEFDPYCSKRILVINKKNLCDWFSADDIKIEE